MRLLEPFNGLKLTSGHPALHFSLLLASIVMLKTETSGIFNIFHHIFDEDQNVESLIQIVRFTHLWVGVTACLRMILEKIDYQIPARCIKATNMYLYQTVALYQQWQIQNLNEQTKYTSDQKDCILWLYLEIYAFYLYIFCAVIILIFVSVRGENGCTDTEAIEGRWQYDALEYYKIDIDWLAFSFVPFVLAFRVSYFAIRTHAGHIKVYDEQGDVIDNSTFGYKEIVLILSLMLVRLVLMITMFRIKDQSRRIVTDGVYILPPIGAIYLLNLFVNIFTHHFMTLVSMVATVDSIMFLFQCIYYGLFLHMQKVQDKQTDLLKVESDSFEITEEGQEETTIGMRRKESVIDKVKTYNQDNFNQDIGQFFVPPTKLVNKHGVDQWKEGHIEIQNDIYSLAFAAFVDPQSQPDQEGYLGKIRLNQNEIADLFMGGLMVVLIQFTMILLIFHLQLTDEEFGIAPAGKFSIIVPRFLAAIMMHLMVEPDISNGICIMKYVVNHPLRFRHSKNSNGKLNYGAILPPFFMGFAQAFVAINVEIVVILYLASLDTLMDIVIKFIALSAIARFDDIYAGSLRDNKIKAAAGKKLLIEFKRNMLFKNNIRENQVVEEEPSDDNFEKSEKWTSSVDKQSQVATEEVPKSNDTNEECETSKLRKQCGLRFMRYIHKFFRIFYVSWGYYFQPFIVIIVTFVKSQGFNIHTEYLSRG